MCGPNSGKKKAPTVGPGLMDKGLSTRSYGDPNALEDDLPQIYGHP